MASLKQLIKETISISSDELDDVLSLFKPVNLSKNEYFLPLGKRCNEVAYIQSGVLRMFHLDEQGAEATHYFPSPNTFVTSHQSLNAQTPTTEGIQALTAAELLVISKKDLEILYQKVPAMQEVGRKATENVVAAMSNRISILINQSAEKRYETIMERHPILIQTVPLQYLASYLGITPQHLSRIRKKTSQSLS
jgi:CRP/FNR family transcriptional regulator, anaerobic regulatory protein